MSSDPPSRYFEGCAETYAAARPPYPAPVLRAALPHPPPVHVVDVGCGTGIASRGLALLGANVLGVDPSPSMLAAATEMPHPRGGRLEFREGTAEATGLPDASTDLVLVAQAFHWFDAVPALAEFARILRPAGRVALLWNVRQTTGDFMRGYEDLVERAQTIAAGRGRFVPPNRAFETPAAPHFRIARQIAQPNPQMLSADALRQRLRSASYWPPEGDERDALERDLTALFARHAKDDRVQLDQNAELTILERTAGAVKQNLAG